MTFDGRVLVVDDEPHIRKFLALVLRKFGNPTVTEAGNGLEAVELYGKEHPDLVLLDVNMPVLDGIQTLERIIQLNPAAVVVMLTSLANRQTIEDCVRLGAVDYIRKDTPRDEMISHLQRIITECFGDEATPPAP